MTGGDDFNLNNFGLLADAIGRRDTSRFGAIDLKTLRAELERMTQAIDAAPSRDVRVVLEEVVVAGVDWPAITGPEIPDVPLWPGITGPEIPDADIRANRTGPEIAMRVCPHCGHAL